MVGQVFLQWGRFGSRIMQIHNARCREREGKPKGREAFFMFKYFLSCHKI